MQQKVDSAKGMQKHEDRYRLGKMQYSIRFISKACI